MSSSRTRAMSLVFLFSLVRITGGDSPAIPLTLDDDNVSAALDAAPSCLKSPTAACLMEFKGNDVKNMTDYIQLMTARRGIFDLTEKQKDEAFMCPLQPRKYGQNPPWYAYQAVKARGPAVGTPADGQYTKRSFTMMNMCPELHVDKFGCVAEGGEFKARVRKAVQSHFRPYGVLGELNCSLRDIVLFRQKKSDELAIRLDFGMCHVYGLPGSQPSLSMEMSAVMGIHKVPDEVFGPDEDTHISDFFNLICSDEAEEKARLRRLSEEDLLKKVEAEFAKQEEIDKDFFHTGPAPHAEARRLNWFENLMGGGGGGGGVQSTPWDGRGANWKLDVRALNNSYQFQQALGATPGTPSGGCLASSAEYVRCLSPVSDCFKPFHMLTLLDKNHRVASIPVAASRFEALSTMFFGKAQCPGDLRACPDGSYVGRDPENNCYFRRCSQARGRRMSECTGEACGNALFNGKPEAPVNPCTTATPPPTAPPATSTPLPVGPDPCTTLTTTTTTHPIVPGECFYDLVCVEMPGCSCQNSCENGCSVINEGLLDTTTTPPPHCCDRADCCWSVEMWCLLVPLGCLIICIGVLPLCIDWLKLKNTQVRGAVNFETEVVIAGSAPYVNTPAPVTSFNDIGGSLVKCFHLALWPLILAIICFGVGFLMQLLYRGYLNDKLGRDEACPCDLWQYLTAMWITAWLAAFVATDDEGAMPRAVLQTTVYAQADIKG